MHGAFQTDRDVTLFGKHLEVAPRSAVKVEYRERRFTLDMLQQRLNVLIDVVIARGFPEFFGTLILVLKREVGDFLQVLRTQFHILPMRATVRRLGGSIQAANIFNTQRHLTGHACAEVAVKPFDEFEVDQIDPRIPHAYEERAVRGGGDR
jgi:hypothetical protein